MYCLSWDSYSHLLATDARHQLNKKGGHSSEEDRQNYLLKPVDVTNFLVKFYWQTENLLVKNGYLFWLVRR